MGIPVWNSKKKQQRQQRIQSALHEHQQSNAHRHRAPHYRLHRSRRQPILLAEPYYIASEGYTTSPKDPSTLLPQQASNSNQQPQVVSSTRLTGRQQIDIESQIQQRFNEKQELLDQLKITISLLDQFLSIREPSGQQLTLPPFITNDLLAVLTATSDTLTSINSTNLDTTAANILPTTNNTPTMPLRSYDRPNNDPSMTSLVDRMIESPPYALQWTELESSIALTHSRVCEQLNRLGSSVATSFSSPSNLTTSRPMQPSPPL